MAVSTVIFFGLVLLCISDVHGDAGLSALANRVDMVERELTRWKLTAVNNEEKLNNEFKVLESSLKEDLTESVIPPLIKPLVKHAIADILSDDFIGNIISGHILNEVQSLKTNLQDTKTQLVAVTEDLRRVERERGIYRKSLRKLRRRLTKDIQAVQLHLKQTEADAKMLKSELRQTKKDLSDTQEKIHGLTEDLITLNTSCVMVKHKVESCTDGLQEIRLKLPTNFHSLTKKLNQTNEDLLDTKRMVSGLTEDLVTLNISCGIKKDVKPREGNESSLESSSVSPLTASTTSYPETTAASTDRQDPSLSTTVPPVTMTTQDSDQRASTDPSQDPGLSTMVPPVTVTTQDSDQHATPSAATGDDLWDASERGDLETVRRIVAAGHVDVNYRVGLLSRTPVMMAAVSGHRDVFEFLVGEGADLSLVDMYGYNVLHFACEGGDLETVKLILSLNVVDVNSRGYWSRTPVMQAAGKGHRDVVEFLVDEGADLFLVDEGGSNALHLACNGGDLETVKLILSLNVADINSRGKDSWTPVMWAAYSEHRDVVEFLVGEGADLSPVDSRGENVLHFACMGGDLVTVKLILSLNVVDVNSRGRLSWTPVMIAAYGGHRDVVEFLVGEGADPSLVDEDGNTILHWACQGGDLETVKLILSLNAVDVNARDNRGWTAADLARDWGRQRVLDLLVSRGAH